MRHQKQGRKLGRKQGPRKALIRGLATDFVLAGKIKTTTAKAKEIKPIIEKYITLSKKNTLASRRQLLAFFYQEAAVNKLLNEIGPKYKERKGGYTRIVKISRRPGDQAQMALIELV